VAPERQRQQRRENKDPEGDSFFRLVTEPSEQKSKARSRSSVFQRVPHLQESIDAEGKRELRSGICLP